MGYFSTPIRLSMSADVAEADINQVNGVGKEHIIALVTVQKVQQSVAAANRMHRLRTRQWIPHRLQVSEFATR